MKPLHDDLKRLVPLLVRTAEYALQGMRVSGVLADLLLAKGLVTREEIDAGMRESAYLTKKLVETIAALEGERPS